MPDSGQDRGDDAGAEVLKLVYDQVVRFGAGKSISRLAERVDDERPQKMGGFVSEVGEVETEIRAGLDEPPKINGRGGLAEDEAQRQGICEGGGFVLKRGDFDGLVFLRFVGEFKPCLIRLRVCSKLPTTS